MFSIDIFSITYPQYAPCCFVAEICKVSTAWLNNFRGMLDLYYILSNIIYGWITYNGFLILEHVSLCNNNVWNFIFINRYSKEFCITAIFHPSNAVPSKWIFWQEQFSGGSRGGVSHNEWLADFSNGKMKWYRPLKVNIVLKHLEDISLRFLIPLLSTELGLLAMLYILSSPLFKMCITNYYYFKIKCIYRVGCSFFFFSASIVSTVSIYLELEDILCFVYKPQILSISQNNFIIHKVQCNLTVHQGKLKMN